MTYGPATGSLCPQRDLWKPTGPTGAGAAYGRRLGAECRVTQDDAVPGVFVVGQSGLWRIT